MDAQTITTVLKNSISSEIKVEERTGNRYLIHANGLYPNGGELRVLFKKMGSSWVFSDEGHTIRRGMYTSNKSMEYVKSMIDRTANTHGVTVADGEMLVKCPKRTSDIGPAFESLMETEKNVNKIFASKKY